MNFLTGLLGFLVMLNLIVIIHEFGHFLAARMFGVHAHEFSIGMGPALYQHQGKETIFSVRALPIGGYVMMAGEEDGSQSEEDDESWLAQVPPEQRLNNKPKWQQIVIMGAGVFMNLVLAVVLFITAAAARGYVVDPAKPVLYEVMEDSPAASAGLQAGDTIVRAEAADGSMVEPETQDELSEFIQFNHDLLQLTVERDGKTLQTEITPAYSEDAQGYLLGYTVENQYHDISFGEAIAQGFQQTGEAATMIFRSLGMLVHGKGVESLSGPIGIYKITDQVISYGWISYLSLIALISVNIGIFNLLPLPALDGGRILILLLESLFRRKIPTRIVEGIIMASFVVLFGIMIFATWNDIARYFF